MFRVGMTWPACASANVLRWQAGCAARIMQAMPKTEALAKLGEKGAQKRLEEYKATLARYRAELDEYRCDVAEEQELIAQMDAATDGED